MKKYTFQYFIIAGLIGLSVFSCRPDEFYPLGDPVNRADQIPGTYNLNTVTQTDLDAQAKGFPSFAVEQDISKAYPFSSLILTLEPGGNFAVASGNAPNIIGFDSGTWALDNTDFPSRIIFSSGSESRSLGLRFLYRLDNGNLTLERVNSSGGKELTAYLFYFEK